MRWSWAIACVLAGCNAIFGIGTTKLDKLDGATSDGVTSDGGANCANHPFTDTLMLFPLQHLETVPSAWPTVRSDGKELWFVRVETPPQIVYALRASSSDVFGDVFPALFSNLDDAYASPRLTADGTDIFFISNEIGGVDRVWEMTRSDRTMPFDASATAVPELANVSVDGLDISDDGLRLYFTSAGMLYVTNRGSRTEAFATPPMALGGGGNYAVPSVSSDQLELFYTPTPATPGGIHRETRSAPVGAFNTATDTAIEADSSNAYADISTDGSTLVLTSGGTLAMLVRSCQ